MGFKYTLVNMLSQLNTYDADGNLIAQSTNASGSTIHFTYDALNQQVAQSFPSGTVTDVVFDKSGNLASLWLASTGAALLGKAYWGGTAIESYSPSSNVAFFTHRNWVGTRRAVTTATGGTKGIVGSLPFGDDAANVTGGTDNSFDGFTGLWAGGTNNTNHAQFREYWNIAGRWLQPDPYYGSYDSTNAQSFNRYAYALNNPLALVDPDGSCSVIIAGINQSPSSQSGQELIGLANQYGANVAFPYAGEDPATSVQNIGLAGVGANFGATATASNALNATLADVQAGGGSFFSLGFSGGAQASISAGAGVGAFGPAAFYDPGLGIGQSLPAGAGVYRGSGPISALVNATSGGNTGTSIPSCGHDVSCAIRNSAALQAALKKAGPCNKQQIFTRNPLTVFPLVPVEVSAFGGNSSFYTAIFFPFVNDDTPDGVGDVTVLPGFTPLAQ